MKQGSLLMLVLLAGLAVYGQEDSPPAQPGLGFRFGPILSTLEGRGASAPLLLESHYRVSAHFAVFLNVPVGRVWHIEPAVSYSLLGSKVSGSIQGIEASGLWNLHYTQVPVMVQLQSRSGIFVETGPQVGFLARAEDDDFNDLEGLLKLRTTEFGWVAGIGYIAARGLGINLRYHLGLTNIWKNDAAVQRSQLTHRVFQLGLSYRMGGCRVERLRGSN